MDDVATELQKIHEEIGAQVHDECYLKTLNQVVAELGSPDLVDGSVPFEVWMGISQAIADASGYRVVLQRAVLESSKKDPEQFSTVGFVDVAVAEPALFIRNQGPPFPVRHE